MKIKVVSNHENYEEILDVKLDGIYDVVEAYNGTRGGNWYSIQYEEDCIISVRQKDCLVAVSENVNRERQIVEKICCESDECINNCPFSEACRQFDKIPLEMSDEDFDSMLESFFRGK